MKIATGRGAALKRLCELADLSLMYVFGSRAGEIAGWLLEKPTPASAESLTADSDVDIGVRSRDGITLALVDKVRLSQALEDLFGCARVDLVDLREADPFLAAEIIRGERLFASDPYRADEYDLYVLRRAGDLAPLERERQALILGKPS
jgi:uncharacterized protein